MPRKAKRTPEEQLRATAFHEAEHAVAHLVYKRRFEYVTITPDGDTLGCVHRGSRLGKAMLSKREKAMDTGFLDFGSLVISSAGVLAEKEITGKFNNRGAIFDHQTISSFLEDRALFSNWAGYQPVKPSRTTVNLWAAAQGEAEAIVSLFWAKIEAIAQALLERKKVTYDETKEICTAVGMAELARRANVRGGGSHRTQT